MSKKRILIVSIILIAVMVMISIIPINNYFEEKQQKQKELNRTLSNYAYLAQNFTLGIYYYELDNPIQVEMFPTSRTQWKLDRWKMVTEILPIIEYPEELIKENAWIEVSDNLERNIEHYRTYYDSKSKIEQESLIRPDAIWSFIVRNSRWSDNLLRALDEAGIDYD
ncbi:hypothetical protein [Amphibacillus cookii]|uniref:hypothetical protein n=1 Tax=Amphibacillus cookii TaxID=767787 RepID=UPI001959D8FE|nr:hypothetical protein [Amphibacillus cookii]MBM7542735.1 hypothetical protein [Amphibacillus cookii]